MGTTLNGPSFRQTGASVALDALRGAAALLVLLDHCKNLFFVDRAAAMRPSAYPHFVSFLYGVASAGPQAVVIFLVLSGYLVGGSVLRATQAERWSWKSYLTQRLVRLWLVLLPALALCACWDAARVGLTGSAAYTQSSNFASALAGAGVTWTNFWGNVFFLQTLVAGGGVLVLPSDSPWLSGGSSRIAAAASLPVWGRALGRCCFCGEGTAWTVPGVAVRRALGGS